MNGCFDAGFAEQLSAGWPPEAVTSAVVERQDFSGIDSLYGSAVNARTPMHRTPMSSVDTGRHFSGERFVLCCITEVRPSIVHEQTPSNMCCRCSVIKKISEVCTKLVFFIMNLDNLKKISCSFLAMRMKIKARVFGLN